MKTIHKFELIDGCWIETYGTFFQPLSVQIQNGIICLWAVVDVPEIGRPDQRFDPLMTRRQLFVYGTGREISNYEKREYLGTVQRGALVWHVFQLRTPTHPEEL